MSSDKEQTRGKVISILNRTGVTVQNIRELPGIARERVIEELEDRGLKKHKKARVIPFLRRVK